MNDSKAVPAAGMHRAKTWEIGFYALNNTSTNTYMMMMMYVSYLVGGIMGVGFALVSVLLTVMRVWDGVTDPIIGFMVDKTNGRLGKNRPFIIIGNLILMVCSFIMFFVGPQLPENFVLRLLFFIVVYAIYIIGYTCQCVVTKSAQSCMTNDPKQRPTFAIFDSIYNAVIMTGLCVSMATVFAILALIGIWRKDRPEYFGLGVAQRIRIRDYWEVLKNNRAIQMLVVAASTDKLFMSVQSNTTIMAVLYGVLFGNIALQGQMSSLVLIPTVIINFLGIKFIASRMGQKKALLFGTYGAIGTSVLMFCLMVWGDPSSFSFTNISFFTIAFCLLWIFQKGFSGISGNIVIPMTADCADYETYRTGKYVPGLMGTLFSFVDKVISSLASTIVALMFALVGYAQEVPTDKSPWSEGLFWVVVIAFTIVPIIGWLCNVVAMKFYPLTKEKMEEIQEKIAEIKAKNLAENEAAAAAEAVEAELL